MSDRRKEYLAETLNVSVDKLSADTLRYYWTKYPEWCCEYQFRPMFPKIAPFEFGAPIQKLAQYYRGAESDYFQRLAQRVNKTKDLQKLSKADADQVILQYVKCRPQTRIITVWPTADLNAVRAKKFADYLQQYGHLYYYKEVSANYAAGRGIVYQLYADKEWTNSLQNIERDKTDWVGFSRKDEQTMWIFAFENTSDRDLIGKDAELKVELRGYLAGLSKIESEKRLKHVLHINDFDYQTVEYAQLYFCENSLKILARQDLGQLMSYRFRKCRIFFNTIKQWFLQNFETIDLNRYLLISSVVFYVLGLRACGDIDMYFINHPNGNESQTEDFYQKIIYYLTSQHSRKGKEMLMKAKLSSDLHQVVSVADGFYFTDWTSKDFGLGWIFQYPDFMKFYSPWEQKLQTHDDWVFDPSHHFYFMGLKILGPHTLMHRRMVVDLNNGLSLIRRKAKRLADMYMLSTVDLMKIDSSFKVAPDVLLTVAVDDDRQEKVTKAELLKATRKSLQIMYPKNESQISNQDLEKFLEKHILTGRVGQGRVGQGRVGQGRGRTSKGPKKKSPVKKKRKSPGKKRKSSVKKR